MASTLTVGYHRIEAMGSRPFRSARAVLGALSAAGLAVAAGMAHAMPVPNSKGERVQEVTTYRTASCSCCKGWVQHMRSHGFSVRDVVVADINAIKRQLGIPVQLSSCHSAQVAGYALEGHVPADAVKRLLLQRPAVAGLAVPGMPVGAPGMEGASGKQPFSVIAFTAAGRCEVFSESAGSESAR